MIQALIIEDEPLARQRMVRMLTAVAPEIQVQGEADSTESALLWLQQNKPDVIFTDIQLGDGTCFDVFHTIPPLCPVVFITAFDEHALKAFQVNAIDYLLKPLKEEDLKRACQRILAHQVMRPDKATLDALNPGATEARFLVRYGDQIRHIRSQEIAYIYTIQKAVFFVLHNGKEYPADQSLETLEKELDPKRFFRINRQFIVSLDAIGPMHTASKSRVQLTMKPPFIHGEVIVSTERSPHFKTWLGKR